jgi:hypothetical protein
MKRKRTWVVIADASRARVFEQRQGHRPDGGLTKTPHAELSQHQAGVVEL